jgi:O-antigen/teichoic acid export membrane protein
MRHLQSENARTRSVLRNMAASYGAFIVQTLLGLVVTPLLLSGLGVQQFGVLAVVLSMATFIAIIEAGVGVATVRRVAAARATGDEDQLRRIATTSLGLWVVAAAAGALVLTVLALVLGHLIDEHGPLLDAARWSLLLLGSAQLSALLLNVYTAILYGSGRSDLLTSTGVVVGVIGGIAQVLAATLVHDVVAVAAASAGGTLATSLAIRHVARRKVGANVTTNPRDFDRSLARTLVSSGWRNAFIGLAGKTTVASDVLVVAALLSVRAAAAYGLASRASIMLRNLATTGGQVLVPTYAHHAALGDRSRLYTLLRESTTASWLLALPAAAAIWGFGAGLLEFWLRDVPAGTLDVLRLLTLAIVFAVPGAAGFTLLSGIERLNFVVVAVGLAAAGNLALSVVLTEYVGVVGPAMATAIAFGVFDFVILPIYACRVLSVRSLQLHRDCGWLILPALVATVFAGAGERLTTGPTAAVVGSVCTFIVFFATAAAAAGRARRIRYAKLLKLA